MFTPRSAISQSRGLPRRMFSLSWSLCGTRRVGLRNGCGTGLVRSWRWAMVEGYRIDDPTGRVLDGTLSRPEPPVHFRALSHRAVVRPLSNSVSRMVGRFPGCFSSPDPDGCEVAGRSVAEWSEIDFASSTWTKPSAHTKTKEKHEVPLSKAAIAVLVRAAELAGRDAEGLIFPSRKGGVISNTIPTYLLKRLEIPCVAHGFRASLRNWCAETRVDFDLG